jgi:hypothetical protein
MPFPRESSLHGLIHINGRKESKMNGQYIGVNTSIAVVYNRQLKQATALSTISVDLPKLQFATLYCKMSFRLQYFRAHIVYLLPFYINSQNGK